MQSRRCLLADGANKKLTQEFSQEKSVFAADSKTATSLTRGYASVDLEPIDVSLNDGLLECILGPGNYREHPSTSDDLDIRSRSEICIRNETARRHIGEHVFLGKSEHKGLTLADSVFESELKEQTSPVGRPFHTARRAQCRGRAAVDGEDLVRVVESRPLAGTTDTIARRSGVITGEFTACSLVNCVTSPELTITRNR